MAVTLVCAVALLLGALPSQVLGHGMLTKPMARQMLIGQYENGVGLTNPGAHDCNITVGNGMNMNGCQGAVTYAAAKTGKDMKPPPRVGVCGGLTTTEDVMAVVNPSGPACEAVGDKTTKSCVEQALQSPRMSTLEVDAEGYFETRIHITAHHWGWSEFRLCTEGEGRGSDGTGVTQECFNKHILSFDTEDAARRYPESNMTDTVSRPGCFSPSSGTACKQVKSPSDYATMEPSTRCDGRGSPQPPDIDVKLTAPSGSCCLEGGTCGDPDDPKQNQRWVFPKPGAASGASVGQTVGGGPTPMKGEYVIRLKLPSDALQACSSKVCTLQWLFMTGNSPGAYPEAFRNCADFKISQGSVAATASPEPAQPALLEEASAVAAEASGAAAKGRKSRKRGLRAKSGSIVAGSDDGDSGAMLQLTAEQEDPEQEYEEYYEEVEGQMSEL